MPSANAPPPVAPDTTRPAALPIRAPTKRQFCRALLPWFAFLTGDEPIARLRRRAYEHFFAASRRGWLYRLRWKVAWPFKLACQSARAACANGQEVTAIGGPPRWQQFTDMLVLGLRHNLAVRNYYLFELWRPQERAQVERYVQDFEGIWIMQLTNPAARLAVIDDKLEFARFCERHALATVPVIAEFGPHGAETWLVASRTLPRVDLFAKESGPLSCLGAGAECWIYDADGDCWSRGGERCDEQALVARLRQVTARTIVQPRLLNHTVIASIGVRALCTVRVITIRPPGGTVRHFHSFLRMPLTPDSDVDHRGLTAAIYAGGALGPAVVRTVRNRWHRHHPDTGAVIEGRVLPDFDAAVALAIRAHEALDLDCSVGWDIALTPSGPRLTEGNSVWGTDTIQTALPVPMADSGLVEDLLRLADRAAMPPPWI